MPVEQIECNHRSRTGSAVGRRARRASRRGDKHSRRPRQRRRHRNPAHRFPGIQRGISGRNLGEEFFEKFDREKLAFLYQDQTAGGQKSNFNKIIRNQENGRGQRALAGGGKGRKTTARGR